jgi:hypothetical protein
VTLRALAAALVLLVAVGCAHEDPDVDAAAEFERFPIYWLGESFEGHELEHISELGETNPGVTIVYGTCDHSGFNGGCAPTLQLQEMPLCFHLDTATRNPIWRTREIRGAPVGSQDGALVLFTRTRQIKVYRGEGSNRGMPMRALETLRSLNDVEPVLAAGGPFPPPAPGVLEGDVPCSD